VGNAAIASPRIGGDCAEEVRIVDDRREEVDRLRDRLITVDAQNRRVVVGAVTDEKIPLPFKRREFRED
jgi:hypothetical protein